MTTAKQSWLKRGLSAVLAATMVLSMNAVSVFAAGDDSDSSSTSAPSYSTEAGENSVMSLEAGGNTYYFDDVASAFAAVNDTTNITGDVTLKVLKDDQAYPVGTAEEYSTTVFEKATGTVTLDLNGHDLAMAGQRPDSTCSLAILSPAFTLIDSTCTTSQAVVDGKENEDFQAGKLSLTNVYLKYDGTGTLTIQNIKGEVLGENGGSFAQSKKASTLAIDNIAVEKSAGTKQSVILSFTNKNATGGVISNSVLKNAYGGSIQLYGEAVLRNNVVEANHTNPGMAALNLSYNTTTVENGSYTNLAENGCVVSQGLKGTAYLNGDVFTGKLYTSSSVNCNIEIAGGYYKGEWKEYKEGSISAPNTRSEVITDGEYAGYTKYTLGNQHKATVQVVDEKGGPSTAAVLTVDVNGVPVSDLSAVHEGNTNVYTVDCKPDYEVKKITYTPSGEVAQAIAGSSTYTMTVPDKDYTLTFTVGETDAVKAGDDIVSIGNQKYKSLTTAMAELKDNDMS